jgi:hypothetical protein
MNLIKLIHKFHQLIIISKEMYINVLEVELNKSMIFLQILCKNTHESIWYLCGESLARKICVYSIHI